MTTRRILGVALTALVAASISLPVVPASANQSNSAVADQEALLYEINRARLDPSAFKARAHDINIPNNTKKAPPLAYNRQLTNSAAAKANDMASRQYFGHRSPSGLWPNQLARNHGYPLPWWWESDNNFIESIHSGSPDPFRVLVSFANSPSHRRHIFGEGDFFSQHREIGVGRSNSSNLWAVHTAFTESSRTWITGAVYNDRNNNGWMDRGEGLSGVTVTAGSASTVTGPGGVYSLRVNNGTHTVTASGGSLGSPQSATVTVRNENVWVDFVSGKSAVIRYGEGYLVAGGSGGSGTVGPGTGQKGNPVKQAVKAARQSHPNGAHIVYLVLKRQYSDATTVAVAAAKQDAAVLVVTKRKAPNRTLNHLQRLRPAIVRVVGNANQINENVVSAVQRAVPFARVERVGRKSVFATSAQLAQVAFSNQVDTVYVARRGASPDGVTAVQAAIDDGAPLLLVRKNKIPNAVLRTLQDLRPRTIVVVGDGVSSGVIQQLRLYTTTVQSLG